jgi:hypothetical protein
MRSRKKRLNNVGRFLFTLRTARGGEQVSQYLAKFKLPISDNYYRDVESGRKRLSLEMAIALTDALQLEDDGKEEFMWHFLRDSLPEELSKKLLMPRVDKSVSSATEAIELLQRDLQLYRKTDAIRTFEENYITDDEVCAFLIAESDLLPIVHHVYLVEETDDRCIRDLCEIEGIEADFDRICRLMSRCGVEIKRRNQNFTFKRAKPVFRVPPTENGRRLLRLFAAMELEKSRKRNAAHIFDPNGGIFEKSSIIAVSASRLGLLRERLQDYLTEARLGNEQGQSDATPFFIMTVVSARPEYAPQGQNLERIRLWHKQHS